MPETPTDQSFDARFAGWSMSAYSLQAPPVSGRSRHSEVHPNGGYLNLHFTVKIRGAQLAAHGRVKFKPERLITSNP